MNSYQRFVRERLDVGDDPNAITDAIEKALMAQAGDWALFGNGRWRIDTVCPVCELWVAGACGHQAFAGAPVLRSDFVRWAHAMGIDWTEATG